MSAIYISWTWTGLPSLYAHAQMAIEQKPTKYSIKMSFSLLASSQPSSITLCIEKFPLVKAELLDSRCPY